MGAEFGEDHTSHDTPTLPVGNYVNTALGNYVNENRLTWGFSGSVDDYVTAVQAERSICALTRIRE